MCRWRSDTRADTRVLGLLRKQIAITIEGINAFVAWTDGDPSAAEGVRDIDRALSHLAVL
jgi:hypothetical protein